MTETIPLKPGIDNALNPAPRGGTGERGRAVCILGTPLSAAAGVTITGVDLTQPLLPELRDRILGAFRDHRVIVFPDQALSREQQYTFTANFGEIERHVARNPQSKRYAVAHVISNLDSEGNPVDRSSSPVSNYRCHPTRPTTPYPRCFPASKPSKCPPRAAKPHLTNP